MIFIMVDLPAPFSPMRACTSPGFRSKSMSNSTSSGPKARPTPASASTGAVAGVGAAEAAGAATAIASEGDPGGVAFRRAHAGLDEGNAGDAVRDGGIDEILRDRPALAAREDGARRLGIDV